MFSMLKPRIMPIFERRVSVKTSGLEANLRESGFRRPPCLGALQFVSDFKRRAREAERDPVYTCNTVKSAKSLLIRLSATLRMRENQ
jgi:hypothetical protein